MALEGLLSGEAQTCPIKFRMTAKKRQAVKCAGLQV